MTLPERGSISVGITTFTATTVDNVRPWKGD